MVAVISVVNGCVERNGRSRCRQQLGRWRQLSCSSAARAVLVCRQLVQDLFVSRRSTLRAALARHTRPGNDLFHVSFHANCPVLTDCAAPCKMCPVVKLMYRSMAYNSNRMSFRLKLESFQSTSQRPL